MFLVVDGVAVVMSVAVGEDRVVERTVAATGGPLFPISGKVLMVMVAVVAEETFSISDTGMVVI